MPPVKAKHARPSLTSILRWKSARPTWWFPKMGVLLDHKFWSDFPLWTVQLLGFICGDRPHEQQMQIIWTYLNLGPRMIWVDFRWWLVLYSSSFGQQIPKHKTSRWWQMFYFLFLPHGHKVTWDSASTRALPIPPAGALRYLPGCRCGGRRCLQISATKISRWDADYAWTIFDSTFMLSVPSMRLFSYIPGYCIFKSISSFYNCHNHPCWENFPCSARSYNLLGSGLVETISESLQFHDC